MCGVRRCMRTLVGHRAGCLHRPRLAAMPPVPAVPLLQCLVGRRRSHWARHVRADLPNRHVQCPAGQLFDSAMHTVRQQLPVWLHQRGAGGVLVGKRPEPVQQLSNLAVVCSISRGLRVGLPRRDVGRFEPHLPSLRSDGVLPMLWSDRVRVRRRLVRDNGAERSVRCAVQHIDRVSRRRCGAVRVRGVQPTVHHVRRSNWVHWRRSIGVPGVPRSRVRRCVLQHVSRLL